MPLLFFISFLILLSCGCTRASQPTSPLAHVKNGTLRGRHLPEYNQDLFLGIRYARPPLNELRFRVPQSIDKAWKGVKDALQYSPECIGYGGDQIGYPTSEDCLTLNVVRPSGNYSNPLPIALWIHGGGFYMGGSRDERYNLSFIVQNSVNIGKPIMGVSMNYRLAEWGFLFSSEVLRSGQTNIGLRDQRLAMHWVSENIAAFGGDPNKITLWGESAGGASVGAHLMAYGGRNDGLFRAAIMESGGPVPYGALNGTKHYDPLFDQIQKILGCDGTLECLRKSPFKRLNETFNMTQFATSWNPTIDNDFIQGLLSTQLKKGNFVHIPVISGINSDEGTAFSARSLNTTEDLANAIQYNPVNPISTDLTKRFLSLYPNNPCFGAPYEVPCGRFGPPYGKQFRRGAAFAGDAVMIANRRLTCETWATNGVAAYCYRFNTIPAGIPYEIGVTHFQEVAFVFDNTNGYGYGPAHGSTPPFQGKPQSYFKLARLMDLSWISFVHDLNPNTFRIGDKNGNHFKDIASWPQYSISNPQEIVFDANVTSFVDNDNYRKESINLINRLAAMEFNR